MVVESIQFDLFIILFSTRISDSAQKYVVKYEELKLNQKLGVGAFGEVWKATYRNAIVAVKQISSKLDLNDKTIAEFVNECEVQNIFLFFEYRTNFSTTFNINIDNDKN